MNTNDILQRSDELIERMKNNINELTEINKRYEQTTNGIHTNARRTEEPDEVPKRTRPEK